MIGDDLTGLLAKAPAAAVDFRQGTVLTYDIFDGSNTVSLAGTVLTNVPLLGNGGMVAYLPGDVVVLMRQGASYAILGRMSSPGSPLSAIGRYTELTGTYQSTTVTNWSTTTSQATKVTLNIDVPAWAETAQVTTSLMLLARNSTAAADFLEARIALPDGSTATWSSGTIDAGEWASVPVFRHWALIVTPGGTLTITGQARSTTAAWAANTSNAAYLQATVTFNSNDG